MGRNRSVNVDLRVKSGRAPPGQAPSQSIPDGTGLAPPAHSEVIPGRQARTSPKSTHRAGNAGNSTRRTRRCRKPPPRARSGARPSHRPPRERLPSKARPVGASNLVIRKKMHVNLNATAASRAERRVRCQPPREHAEGRQAQDARNRTFRRKHGPSARRT